MAGSLVSMRASDALAPADEPCAAAESELYRDLGGTSDDERCSKFRGQAEQAQAAEMIDQDS